jgi:hypothetical protein
MVSGTRLFRRLWANLACDTLLKAPAISRLSIDATRGLFPAQIVYTCSVNRSSAVSVKRCSFAPIYVPGRSACFSLKKRRRLATIDSSALPRVFSSAIGL